MDIDISNGVMEQDCKNTQNYTCRLYLTYMIPLELK